MVPQRYGHQGEGGGSRAGRWTGRAHALVGLPWIADGTGGRWRIGGRSESWHGLHAIGANAVDVLSRLSA